MTTAESQITDGRVLCNRHTKKKKKGCITQSGWG